MYNDLLNVSPLSMMCQKANMCTQGWSKTTQKPHAESWHTSAALLCIVYECCTTFYSILYECCTMYSMRVLHHVQYTSSALMCIVYKCGTVRVQSIRVCNDLISKGGVEGL